MPIPTRLLLLSLVLALFALPWNSANGSQNSRDPSFCKQTDIRALIPRVGEVKPSLRSAPELASPHLFCPGANAIATNSHERSSLLAADGRRNALAFRSGHLRGRAPPRPA